jgi:tol-pal system protein YbgF
LTFLIQFPDHELAGHAQYWLGETAYSQQKYELAVKEFDKVLKQYQKSPKVPASLLKKGMAQIALNQKKSARATLEKLVNSYSKSEEAKQGRVLLKSL